MRYTPMLRSPVSGSFVTTQGSVMKRPPSRGQHFWMGRFKSVGSTRASRVVVGASPTACPPWGVFPASAPETARESGALPRMSGAAGHGSVRVGGASNLWMTSLHGPLFKSFGLAWRRSRAVPRSLMASLKLVGGLAFMSDPSSAATVSTDSAHKLRAMRFQEPIVLIARGNGDTAPFTVGFSYNSAF